MKDEPWPHLSCVEPLQEVAEGGEADESGAEGDLGPPPPPLLKLLLQEG